MSMLFSRNCQSFGYGRKRFGKDWRKAGGSTVGQGRISQVARVAIWVAIQGSTQFCRAAVKQLKKSAVLKRATAGQLGRCPISVEELVSGIGQSPLISSYLDVHSAC
jgi:hypothetical protein